MKALETKDITQLHSFIMEAAGIVVTVHTHPDGDALGCARAMSSYLEKLGKKVTVVLPDKPDPSLDFVLDGNYIVFGESNQELKREIEGCPLLLCLDFSSFSRTGAAESVLRRSKARKVLIDHHLNPDREAFDLCISDTGLSSACELLYHLLLAMPETEGDPCKLPREAADALMTGMTTDTNNFANSVFPSTLRMAADLIDAGVDRGSIVSRIYNHYRENRLRAMGFLLEKGMRILPEGVAYMILDMPLYCRFGVQEGETEGFVNLPLAMEKVRMSIFLREDKGLFRVSVRSKEGVSANLFAQRYFHGGGHEMAAGGKLFYPADIARKKLAPLYVEEAVREFFNGEAGV